MAQVTSLSFHAPARDFGYFAGDVLITETSIGVAPGTMLDPRSLPVPGALNSNLDVRHIDAVQTGNAIRIRAEFQNFLSPEHVMQTELPALSVRFLRGSAVYTAQLPAFPFHVSPLRVAQRIADDAGDLRANHPVAALPTRGALLRVLASGLVAALAGLVFAGRSGWLPGLRRPARPFARAARRIAKAANAQTEALQELHRAFDATAQRHVFAADLDEFIAARPRYASLRPEIDAFFQRSEQVFFSRDPQGTDTSLLRLAKKLRRVEASW